ncbi:MAG: dihydrodipicolinate synthase family protein [Chloroflexota bacterium]
MSFAPPVLLRGVFVPLLTPFDAAGEVDHPALQRLVDYLIAGGVHGLFVGGTTGEFPLLSTQERRRIAETVVSHSAGRRPVVIQSGTPSTRETIALSQHARGIGAAAVAVVAPYFFPLSDQDLVEHYATVCAALHDTPVLLYNIPQRTDNAVLPRVAAAVIRRCPNVIGIKDSSGNLSQTQEYCTLAPDFQVAQGADGLLVAGLAMGIQATVSGNANVVPELAVAVFDAWWRGDYAAARAAQLRLNAARHALRDGGDLSLFKRVLARRGIEVGDVRSPLRRATTAEVDTALATVTAALEDFPLATPALL